MREYLTVSQVAERIHRSPKAVYHLVSRGVLPVVRVDRRLLFVGASVDAVLLHAQRIGPGMAAGRPKPLRTHEASGVPARVSSPAL